LTALLVGGKFSSFELYADASGVAMTAASGRLARALVAAGGLVGPSLTALVFFMMGKTPGGARFCLFLTALALAWVLLMIVQNGFGWFFVAGLAAFCAVVALRGGARLAQLVLVFAGTQLALSVYSRSDYLFTTVAATGGGDGPSDVALISEALLLPY